MPKADLTILRKHPKEFICLSCGKAAHNDSRPNRKYCNWTCRDKYKRRIDVTLKRFWNKVEMTNYCWLWVGGINNDGYGQLSVAGRLTRAPRFAYEMFIGDIERDKVIDHYECSNRQCVNPWHLKQVTVKENSLRSDTSITAINSRKTHCLNGHPFSKTNTYICRGTVRNCRKCRQTAVINYRRRQSLAVTT